MTTEDARWNMICRLLRLDDGEDEDDEESPEAPVQGGGRSNTRLPYGLCKRFGIDLPDGTTPRQAWDALKEGTGITAREAYTELQKKGSTKELKAKNGKSKNKFVSSTKDYPSLPSIAKYSGKCIGNATDKNTVQVADCSEYGGGKDDAVDEYFNNKIIKLRQGIKDGLKATPFFKKTKNMSGLGNAVNEELRLQTSKDVKKMLSSLEVGTIMDLGEEHVFGEPDSRRKYIKTGDNQWRRYIEEDELLDSPVCIFGDAPLTFSDEHLMYACYGAWEIGTNISIRKMENDSFSCYVPQDDESDKNEWKAAESPCKIKQYSKAESVEDAEDNLYRNLHGAKVNLSDCKNLDVESANTICNAVLSIKDKYGLEGPSAVMSGNCGKNVIAGYHTLGKYLKFANAKIGGEDACATAREMKETLSQQREKYLQFCHDSNIQADWKVLDTIDKAIQSNYETAKYKCDHVHKAGQDALSIVLHEMGHMVSDELFHQSGQYYLIERVRNKAIESGDIYKISQYASNENPLQKYHGGHDEFFAECFAMYHLKMPLPPYIRDLMEYAEFLADRRKAKKAA